MHIVPGSYTNSALFLIGHYFLVYAVSTVTDKVFIPLAVNHRLIHALCDNICHGLISLLSWVSFLKLTPFSPQLHNKSLIFDSLASYAAGAVIDIDHFIAAKSIYLHSATNLSSRPFGHCCITAIPIITALISICYPNWKKPTCLFLLAYSSHMLRDSTRRGLWLIPGVSTRPIPYMMHIFVLSLMPLVMSKLWTLDESRQSNTGLPITVQKNELSFNV